MLLAGFDPAIPPSERPQTHALDRAATGIGSWPVCTKLNLLANQITQPARNTLQKCIIYLNRDTI